MEWKEIVDLTKILKENGDKILDASSKLSLSTSLLGKMNESFKKIFRLNETVNSTFHVLPNNEMTTHLLDLQLLYDFVQKTLALKIYPEENVLSDEAIDISFFKNLKLLEIHRFSSNLLMGLKCLRSQLEYLICIRSVRSLKEILENCGGDKVQGFLWNELKEAVFCHNSIDYLDSSLEFVPQLHSIDLSHNRIQNAQCINCLLNLRYLNLGFNHIESVPSFNTQLCDTLKVLVLRNNYIDDIRELATLVNLCELDLSNNCLVEHNQLFPLTFLQSLHRLVLNGNPLSYHPKHRRKTVMYIQVKVPRNFFLDNSHLSSSELRMMGLINVSSGFDRSSSMNSVTSVNTVIPVKSADFTSDIEISDGSSLSNNQILNGDWNESETRECDRTTMQDSGFVPESRRLSASDCSIENSNVSGCAPVKFLVIADIHNPVATNKLSSTTSLNSKVETIRNCESDIEVLSNPSQSSIEVLSCRSDSKYVQSSTTLLPSIVREGLRKSDVDVRDMIRKSL